MGGSDVAWEALTAPLTDSGSAVASKSFPWNEIGQLLRERYRNFRRHFVFEYYPWYANDPFRHWQQWDREPPADIGASSVPLLGPYDSYATDVGNSVDLGPSCRRNSLKPWSSRFACLR